MNSINFLEKLCNISLKLRKNISQTIFDYLTTVKCIIIISFLIEFNFYPVQNRYSLKLMIPMAKKKPELPLQPTKRS